MRLNRAFLCALAVAFALGCDEQTKECQRLLASAQEVVTKVDSKNAESVEKSLALVESARVACDAAGRGREREELLKAENQLRAHRDYLRKKATERKQQSLTPEQIERLVKNGDPTCPKGQAYKHGGSTKEIRCRGPQIVEMTPSVAKEYFEGRGYKVKREPPATLRAEYGAELFVFTFEGLSDQSAPRCLTIYPPPGMSWQEAAARATGEKPARLEPDKTVPSSRGPLLLRVHDDAKQTVVRVGACEVASP